MNCCSVIQLCPTLFDPVNCSMPAFPVLHHLPEFVQTHVHWVSDGIQPSHITPFSCLQSFPASGSFPINWLFTQGAPQPRKKNKVFLIRKKKKNSKSHMAFHSLWLKKGIAWIIETLGIVTLPEKRHMIIEVICLSCTCYS